MTHDPPPSASQPSKYDAFISYRREDPDRAWAVWLQRALETYRPPSVTRRSTPAARRSLRVFRDDSEASASPSLTATLSTALEASRYLIVVASPRSAASTWVEREVGWFLDHGRRDRVLVLLIEGVPATSFPPSLRGEGAPLAADVRPPGPPSLRTRRRDARLRLVAPLLGVDHDALVRRDTVRRRRRRAVLGLVGGALGVAIAWIGSAWWTTREEARQTKGTLAQVAGDRDLARAEREAADLRAASEARDAEAARTLAAQKEVALAAESKERAREEEARRSAQVVASLERARDLIETGRPTEAAAEVNAALDLKPACLGARVLLGRLKRERAALRASVPLDIPRAGTLRRCTPDSPSWIVEGQGPNFQPVVLVVGPDGAARGAGALGVFAASTSPWFSRDGAARLRWQPAFAGRAILEAFVEGRAEPSWHLTEGVANVHWSAISPDGRRLAYSRLGEGTVHVESVLGDAPAVTIRVSSSAGAFLTPQRLLLGRFPSGAEVLDAASGTRIESIDTGSDRLGEILYARDGVVVAESTPDRFLVVDTTHGRVTARLERTNRIEAVSAGSSGAPYLVVFEARATPVRVVDVASGRILRTVPPDVGDSSLLSAAARPGAREFVTHHLDATVRRWAVDSEVPPVVLGPVVAPTLGGPNGLAVPTPFDATGARLLGLAEAGHARVWDVESGRVLAEVRVSPDTTGGGLSLQGDEVHAVTTSGRFERWGVSEGAEPSDWSVDFPDSILASCTSKDGTHVACGGGEGGLVVVRTRDGTVVPTPPGSSEWITSLAFTEKADLLVVTPRYREPARVIDLATGAVIHTLDVRRQDAPPALDMSGMYFLRVLSLVGDEVLVIGSNGAAVWNARDARVVARLSPSGEDTDAWVGEDGTTVLVAPANGPAAVWRREPSGWERAREVSRPTTAETWLGVRTKEGVALAVGPGATIDVVPWRKDAATVAWSAGEGIRRIELLPGGEVALIAADGSVHVRTLLDGAEKFQVRGPPRRTQQLPFDTLSLERSEPSDVRTRLDKPASLLAASTSPTDVWIADVEHRVVLLRFASEDPTASIALCDAGATLVRIGDRRIDGHRIDPAPVAGPKR